MTKNSKRIIYFFILAGIFGGGYWWYKSTISQKKNIEYITSEANKGLLTVSVTGTGQVKSVNQVDLKPVIAGDAIEVSAVYVKNEQAVKKEELIALLDSEDARKSIRNAQLNLQSAENKYAQIKRQYNQEKIGKYDKEAQKITVQQQRNYLIDAQEKLEDYYVRAPFDGLVTGLDVSAGDSVSRSDILASVITKDVLAGIVLNEVDAVKVKVGDKAILKFDALPDITLSGKISKIDTIGTVSQGVVSYNAEIVFDTQNEKLKPGMNVSASIITETKSDALLVPGSAIKTDSNGFSYIEIKDGGMPQMKNIQIGLSNGTETEIVSGLEVGEKVITQTIDPETSTSSPSSAQNSRNSSSSGFRIPGLTGGNPGMR